ncbi:O-antigen ligase family protein [Bacteroidota bacterium]
MKAIIENTAFESFSRKNVTLFILGVLLVFPILFILKTSIGIKGVVILLGIALGMVSVYNFYISLTILILLIFTPYFLAYHQVVYYTTFVFLAFLVNYKGHLKKELTLPIFLPYLIYCVTTIPSLINTPSLTKSLLDSYNLVAFFIASFTTLFMIDSHRKILNLVYFFLFGVFVHSLIVIYLGLSSGERVFGLLNVFYVDLAGLAGINSFILFIFLKGRKKVITGLVFIVSTFGLILTQTRNAWLSFAVAFISFVIYLLIKGPSFNVKRSVIFVNALVSIAILGVIFLYSSGLTSDIQQRFEVQTQTQEIVDQDPHSIAENSLVSRFFIFHTAINAFVEHPYIGIGLYSFKYASKMYYTIPRSFYKYFVENKTPHVTYLEVLTETGILGFIGFMVFLFALIKFIIKSLKTRGDDTDNIRTLLICWSFVYIIFSMFMTEAWLYGQFIVWMGILVGLLISNYNIITKKDEKRLDANR